MNICVIGTGYVGLVTGVVFADLGNEVVPSLLRLENQLAQLAYRATTAGNRCHPIDRLAHFGDGIGRLVIEYSREATSDPAKVYTAMLGAALLGLAVAGFVALVEWPLTRHRRRVLLP